MKSRMRCGALALVVMTTGLVLAGCQSAPPAPQSLQYGPNESIYVTSPRLAQALRFSPTPLVDRAGSNLEVSVPCQSLGGERYILDYHFVWYDERGAEVAPAMGWREIIFEPGQTRNFQGTAPNSRATGWKLEVRWSNV